MKRMILIALAASAFACPAGSPGPVYENREPTEEVRHRSESERFYIVTRQDYRKCMYPMCGGVFIAEVNREESTCLDDSLAADCYVSDVDLSALGLSSDDLSEYGNLARDGHLLVRGAISPHGNNDDVGVLEVTAAWRGATLNQPTGNWYQVKDTGIVCITYPCPSVSQLTLNIGDTELLGAIDLTPTNAGADDLAMASNEIFQGGLMVSGTHDIVTGPGGDASELVAAEFYLPIGGEVGGDTCGNTVCPTGQVCCNASCNMCAPPDAACIQIACEPEGQCEHNECNQGDALVDGCSDCATDVCAADPFCCESSWDGLCVQQAQQMCGDTCAPPPPPACVHPVCEAGGKLEAACSTCAATVCAADSFCCDTEWDALCVQQAEASCSECEPAASTCSHDTCQPGGSLEAGCSTCATAVCDADPYCCEVAWDGVCVSEANTLCGGC